MVGRAVLPREKDQRIPVRFGSGLLVRKRPPIPVPEGFQEMSQKDRSAWRIQWSHSEEGTAYRRVGRCYLVKIQADDVLPDSYLLYIRATTPPDKPYADFGEWIAHLSHEFTVPEMPGGRSDEPLDLGELELTLGAPTLPRPEEPTAPMRRPVETTPPIIRR